MWSAINVENVARLIAEKRMQTPGLAHVEAAKADDRWAKAYSARAEPPADLLAAIEREPRAKKTYASLSAQNRFALTFRVLTMKTEEGRARKIADLVAMLKKGKTIYPQKPSAAKSARGVGAR